MQYTKEHLWVKINENLATIGLTDYAQKQLTDIVFVEIVKKPSEEVKILEKIAVIESVKAVSEITSPLTGKIIETNQELNESPELINEDPLNKGWLVKIKISNNKELDLLKDTEN